ncbi:MAG: ribbon-helix-helix protein, CopG family [Alphaproteobacteria bacterium]
MLSFLKRKPELSMPVEAAPVLAGCDQPASQPVRGACLAAPNKQPQPAPQPAAKRNRQQNIKVSDDCAAAFAAMAKALGLSKAALFEDLVAERLDELQRRGVRIEV